MLSVSIGIFVGSCVIVEVSGGVGPCGPASPWGIIWLFGYPIGFIGMLVGVVLSLFRTYGYFRTRTDNEPKEKIERET